MLSSFIYPRICHLHDEGHTNCYTHINTYSALEINVLVRETLKIEILASANCD